MYLVSDLHSLETDSKLLPLLYSDTLVSAELTFSFSVALQPSSGLSHLIVEVSRSHTIRHTQTHPVGLL